MAGQQDSDSPYLRAVELGSYRLHLDGYDELLRKYVELYVHPKKSPNLESQKDKTRRALDAIPHCITRCGLINPIFDPGTIAAMPFGRPTTVVADTSAVVQGALDFVARFLYPMARIKLPAIVHMEILNMADRYLSCRRTSPDKINPAATLLEHVTSQACQRVLLRLELQTDMEIERPRLGADPLRGIVQPGSDAEDKALTDLQETKVAWAFRILVRITILVIFTKCLSDTSLSPYDAA